MLVLKHEHNTNKHINSKKHMNPQTPKKQTYKATGSGRSELGGKKMNSEHCTCASRWEAARKMRPRFKGNVELGAGKVDNAFIVVCTLKHKKIHTQTGLKAERNWEVGRSTGASSWEAARQQGSKAGEPLSRKWESLYIWKYTL